MSTLPQFVPDDSQAITQELITAYEAMTGWRSYRPSLSSEEALEEIASQAGKQFDPRLAGVFVQLHRTLEVGNGLP